VKLRGGWNVSTISRILKDEKYTGKFVSNRTTTMKDPLQERTETRIIPDEDRAAPDARWREIDGVFPNKRKGKKGFEIGSSAATSSPARRICSRAADPKDHPAGVRRPSWLA
jgi:hypothetical protein